MIRSYIVNEIKIRNNFFEINRNIYNYIDDFWVIDGRACFRIGLLTGINDFDKIPINGKTYDTLSDFMDQLKLLTMYIQAII